MCGRFSQFRLGTAFLSLFHIEIEPNFKGSKNIAPSELAHIIRRPNQGEFPPSRSPKYIFSPHSFGLFPSWAKPDFKPNYTFNARSETLEEKPSFKGSYKYKRCIIPVDGYFEWKTEGKRKIPFYIKDTYNKPLFLAGLYDIVERHDMYIQSFSIITKSSEGNLKEIHDRMPVFLNVDQSKEWMNNKEKIEYYFGAPKNIEFKEAPVEVSNARNKDIDFDNL
ncbi:MAG: SOS response-associated peptidase [Leptospiraceae bacterium]|nr:SOS response-associated peptidase [Leptospiraceae bacterium]